MNLVKAGRYTAKVKEHGITETKNGDPLVAVRFEFEYENGVRELVWFGSFKEKALPFTIKALLACGLQGNNPGGPLTIGQEVSIVVDEDKDQDGKPRNVVSWVNAPGGLGGKVMEQAEAKARLEKFSGAVMAALQTTGQQVKNHAPQKKAAGHPFAPGNSDESDPWD